MARARLDRRLEELHDAVRELATLALDQLRDALSALADCDPALAREVVDGDDRVNDQYLAVERLCIDVFALEQPVAGDLRTVAAAFKISTDLERVADLAGNLAERALDGCTPFAEVDLASLGARALAMLEDALDTYPEGEAWACHEIADRDTELDAMCAHAGDSVVRELITTGDGDTETLVADASAVLLAVRDVERVGDHAVNVAARTLYAAEGDPELIY